MAVSKVTKGKKIGRGLGISCRRVEIAYMAGWGLTAKACLAADRRGMDMKGLASGVYLLHVLDKATGYDSVHMVVKE